VAPSDSASEDVFGSCDELTRATKNDTDIVHPFPWGDEPYWRDGVPYQPPKHLPPRTWDPNAPKQHKELPETQPPSSIEQRILATIGAFSLLYWSAKGLAGLVPLYRRSRRPKHSNGYGTVDEDSPLMMKSLGGHDYVGNGVA